jgi:hypothetical protein
MPTLMSRVTQFARSRQGRELMGQAMRKARDPRTRARIQQARQRLARRR